MASFTETLNHIFKQAVVCRDWKSQMPTLLDLLQNEPTDLALAKSLTEIMLKVMVIPPASQKSA